MSNERISPSRSAHDHRNTEGSRIRGEAWAAIEELSGGHLVANPGANPSMLVLSVGDEITTRWFGQKLPKNAVPVGVVDDRGMFVAGSGVALSDAAKLRIAALHGLDKPEGSFQYSNEEISSIIRDELVELAKEKHSDSIPPWSRRLGLAISPEDIKALFVERQGRITDGVDVVVEDYDAYDVLDLIAWMVENHAQVSTERLAYFLYGGTQFMGSTWIRILWVRMTMASGLDRGSAMHDSLMRAYHSLRS